MRVSISVRRTNFPRSLLWSQFTGTIYEVMSAPISFVEILLGYVGAAATKSFIIGLIENLIVFGLKEYSRNCFLNLSFFQDGKVETENCLVPGNCLCFFRNTICISSWSKLKVESLEK